jgi:dienelactone hydrolase
MAFGAEDKSIPADSVRAFESALKKQGTPVDVKIYEGAGHAFANPSRQLPGRGRQRRLAADDGLPRPEPQAAMKKGGGESLATSPVTSFENSFGFASAYFPLTYLAQFFPSLSVV